MNNHIIIKNLKTDFGELILGSFGDYLCISDWKYRKMRNEIDTRISTGLKCDFREGTSEVIENAIDELNQYFSGKLKSFTTPLLFVGTDFQKTVWNALLEVKYGTTSSYLELSKSLNKQDAIRAVASANGANALSIFVPCHRIIGSNGDLVGYAGGLNAKKKLLLLENSMSQQELFD
jgi:methylated-DNA-[protein]-cysteine S-methyltransferase